AQHTMNNNRASGLRLAFMRLRPPALSRTTHNEQQPSLRSAPGLHAATTSGPPSHNTQGTSPNEQQPTLRPAPGFSSGYDLRPSLAQLTTFDAKPHPPLMSHPGGTLEA